MKELNESELKLIHNAIHNSQTQSININDNNYNIEVDRNGLRKVIINNIEFIQEDNVGTSPMSGLARQGHKVTWGNKITGSPILILDDDIINE